MISRCNFYGYQKSLMASKVKNCSNAPDCSNENVQHQCNLCDNYYCRECIHIYNRGNGKKFKQCDWCEAGRIKDGEFIVKEGVIHIDTTPNK